MLPLTRKVARFPSIDGKGDLVTMRPHHRDTAAALVLGCAAQGATEEFLYLGTRSRYVNFSHRRLIGKAEGFGGRDGTVGVNHAQANALE